jgi:4-diphosphocytidyl-2-C-methyl-D-erythritol kinase
MIRDETADLLTTSIAEAAARVESARAKINLALHVRGRRADGYHDLESLVAFTELADVLSVSPHDQPAIEIGIDGPFADRLAETTPPADNLVYAVADALIRSFPDRAPAGIRLELAKNLPLAAGIGGGSADAAAALRLLNRTWQVGLTMEQLIELGAHIGADVPACVLSRPALVEGIGEHVTPVALPEIPLVLVNPGVAVATPDVFRRLRSANKSPLPPLPAGFASIMEVVLWLRKTRNDLFEPACAIAPVIERVVRTLAGDPDCLFTRMSGSGATVFGIFPTIDTAMAAAERLGEAQPDWWIAVTRTEGS